jgi:hypothetical protein
MLLAILAGGWVQGQFPEGHQNSDSKEVVKLSLGIMGTLAALVLGLLVVNAQSAARRLAQGFCCTLSSVLLSELPLN